MANHHLQNQLSDASWNDQRVKDNVQTIFQKVIFQYISLTYISFYNPYFLFLKFKNANNKIVKKIFHRVLNSTDFGKVVYRCHFVSQIEEQLYQSLYNLLRHTAIYLNYFKLGPEKCVIPFHFVLSVNTSPSIYFSQCFRYSHTFIILSFSNDGNNEF